MSNVKPISPSEVAQTKLTTIPDEVFEVVNELIAENYRNGYACVLQKEIVSRLKKRGLSEREIFNRGWLDFEPIYREAGWKVTYDKPGFNESYDASFEFRKK